MNGGWKTRTAALALATLGLLGSACGDTTAVTPAPVPGPAGPSPAVVALEPTAGDPYHETAPSAPASSAAAEPTPSTLAPAGGAPDATLYTPAD